VAGVYVKSIDTSTMSESRSSKETISRGGEDEMTREVKMITASGWCSAIQGQPGKAFEPASLGESQNDGEC
jgi:hypothetical protein